ncbi:hypothetical protein SAMN05518854_103117 [Variovorax sp. YR266]|uniref:hypothetical protein n=1 Tax=Variovorax sp. YR266 TaxID=1884386 RepID=UPI00089BB76D|nr:hypothetical protein [Variovorax sp. YR266]SDY97341.1 hypothetical protein SAMN05518854_103117 [Variovorax sp. YR266]
MGKRKVFVKSDLATARIEYTRNAKQQVVISADVIPPDNLIVHIGRNASSRRRFDFGPWYGVGIDPITYACQRQIERFLDKQDSDVEVSTVVAYCVSGLRQFLDYLVLRSTAARQPLSLAAITRDTVDGYLGFLRDKGYTTPTQQTCYNLTKSVLVALGRRGVLELVNSGDDRTFPMNPFPGSHHHTLGETPLSREQRKAFTVAVKTAVMPLFTLDAEPSSTLLAHALLVVALHTGRNTTPLLEMPVDCLRAHPKDDIEFLVLYKRRGHTTTKVALRSNSTVDRVVESTPTLRPTVVRLIRRVIELTATVREEAPAEIRERVWLFRSRAGDRIGQISTLSNNVLGDAVSMLVREYRLTDSEGKPMRINVSRLRKTFTNRVNEILDGDTATTAIAAGNTPSVTARHYLRPSEEARRNWQFMGTCLVKELLANTLGATARTPVGRCSDNRNGDYAPKRHDAVCESFLNCLRCRNYVVTGDDLWRLYSFYWRVLREQPRMEKRRWERLFSHIPRLIERDVIEAGIARKLFKRAQVAAARERARHDPHPFWASETIISELDALT